MILIAFCGLVAEVCEQERSSTSFLLGCHILCCFGIKHWHHANLEVGQFI